MVTWRLAGIDAAAPARRKIPEGTFKKLTERSASQVLLSQSHLVHGHVEVGRDRRRSASKAKDPRRGNEKAGQKAGF
jgi:hypothetical protein